MLALQRGVLNHVTHSCKRPIGETLERIAGCGTVRTSSFLEMRKKLLALMDAKISLYFPLLHEIAHM